MRKNHQNSLVIFENFKVRRHYDEKTENWYFSVIDIIAVLIGQTNFKKAKSYWTTLKSRLKEEGSEVVTKCDQLKMLALDGKMRATDVADTETILRLVQSVPSPKAEPVKLWLAKVGQERIREINNPEIALNRSRELWKKHGRSQQWIERRMMGQETRNKLTDYWSEHDVKRGNEFAILTNIIHKEWSDLSVKGHKALKSLMPAHNLRDHMNEAELILTALAEMSTRQIAEGVKAAGLQENIPPAKKGGQVAKNARKELEAETGKSVISNKNFLAAPKRIKKLSEKG